jgi:formylglycine-generating enzyme required for sulfatase activity
MRKQLSMFVIISMLLLSVGLYAEVPHAEQPVPFGTVRLAHVAGVEHAEYIDENLISIGSWRTYMHTLGRTYGTQSARYKATLPDSSIIKASLDASAASLGPSAWRHPAFDNQPIVGISYEQALQYAAWRTDVVNEHLRATGAGYTVEYKLPTKIDFEEAHKQQKNVGANMQEMVADRSVLQAFTNTQQAKGFRLFNRSARQTASTNFQAYQKPDYQTGFRCVASIVR